MSARPKPLDGLTVIDLTRLLPGPMATLHLADLGAEVIKIESPGGGDDARTLGAMNGDTSYFYQLLNRNKKHRVLDLKQPADHATALALIDAADILVEGFRPGVMARLGLDYATLAARNPRLVYCSISGYGQSGPYAQRAGHDINYLGYAGVLDQTGVAGGPPALCNLQIADLLGGALTPLVGVLEAKFWHRVCDTLARPDLKPHHLARGADGAYARRDLDAIFATRTQAEWVAVFDPVDCCVTPVLRLDESLQNPQLQARGMVVEVGGMRQFAPPFGLSDFDFGDARPAVGAETDGVRARARADDGTGTPAR